MKKLDQHQYSDIDATVVADSINPYGDRITTFVATFPRMILAELNTHRMLSRNSASSRAIPFAKMHDSVLNSPFIPLGFQRDHKGMQGTEYLKGQELIEARSSWLLARASAADEAKLLHQKGVTKQLCNRIMEPFLWHTAIITATEYENFFALRAHPAAEIHIAALAETMLAQINQSNPKKLLAGEWHVPFGDMFDDNRLLELAQTKYPNHLENGEGDLIEKMKVKIATARCARVSYFNFEGKDDYEADIKLHDNLSKMGHWSPFEHCAQAMREGQYFWNYPTHGVDSSDISNKYNGWSGNFKGFTQYRKIFAGESKNDSRLIKK